MIYRAVNHAFHMAGSYTDYDSALAERNELVESILNSTDHVRKDIERITFVERSPTTQEDLADIAILGRRCA